MGHNIYETRDSSYLVDRAQAKHGVERLGKLRCPSPQAWNLVKYAPGYTHLISCGSRPSKARQWNVGEAGRSSPRENQAQKNTTALPVRRRQTRAWQHQRLHHGTRTSVLMTPNLIAKRLLIVCVNDPPTATATRPHHHSLVYDIGCGGMHYKIASRNHMIDIQ